MSVARQDDIHPAGTPLDRPASVTMEWRAAITAFSTWSRQQRKAATTIRTRTDHLQKLARGVRSGPWDLSGDELLRWFTLHAWQANTYRANRTTVRAFYRWALDEGRVSSSPAAAIPVVAVPPPNPQPVPDRVYDAAVSMAEPRVLLMCLLAAGHGLRRGEVAVVHPGNDLVEDLEGWSLLVHGKGGKERVVPLEAETARLLRALPPGYAFPGRIDGHLSPQRVGNLVSAALEGSWTMHKLRHRAGTNFHEDSGYDLRVVQELLGHAHLNTTMLYVEVNRARKRQAVEGARSTTASRHTRQTRRPAPAPTAAALDVPEDLWTAAQQRAEVLGEQISDVIVLALRRYVRSGLLST